MKRVMITRKHDQAELSERSPIEKKIEIFRERVYGWQLHIADLVINGGRNDDDTEDIKPIEHSGFATLQILLSYFETIARYEAGSTEEGRSREMFIEGFLTVFPQVRSFPYLATRKFLDHLYKSVR